MGDRGEQNEGSIGGSKMRRQSAPEFWDQLSLLGAQPCSNGVIRLLRLVENRRRCLRLHERLERDERPDVKQWDMVGREVGWNGVVWKAAWLCRHSIANNPTEMRAAAHKTAKLWLCACFKTREPTGMGGSALCVRCW